MGLYDNLRCEMPLPAPAPPAGTVFQTKDTPEQYLEPYRITADGRLVYEKRTRVREPDPSATGILAEIGTLRTIATEDIDLDYHGAIGFGHLDSCTGEDWGYVARFTEGRCVRIWPEGYRPPTKRPVEATLLDRMSRSEMIATLKAAGFIFAEGHDTPEDPRLDGPHEAIRSDARCETAYRMWVPIDAPSPTGTDAGLGAGDRT